MPTKSKQGMKRSFKPVNDVPQDTPYYESIDEHVNME